MEYRWWLAGENPQHRNYKSDSIMGHSMSDHPMLETVPPQILIKSYTFGLCD